MKIPVFGARPLISNPPLQSANRHAVSPPDRLEIRFGQSSGDAPDGPDGMKSPFEDDEARRNRELFEQVREAYLAFDPIGTASLLEQLELIREQLGPVDPAKQLSWDLDNAIGWQDLEGVANALMAGADPNEHVFSAMMAASGNCAMWETPKPNRVLAMLAAHPQFKPELAVPFAVQTTNPRALETLLKDPRLDKTADAFKNALLDFPTGNGVDRRTGKMFARDRETLSILLATPGIDLNAAGRNGWALLHHLAYSENEEALLMLLAKSGVDTSLKTSPKPNPKTDVPRLGKTAVALLDQKILDRREGLETTVKERKRRQAERVIEKLERMRGEILAYSA